MITLRYIQQEFNLKLDDLQQNYAIFSKLSKQLSNKIQENEKVVESFNKLKD
jgi:chaperonin cofactor prefoldin